MQTWNSNLDTAVFKKLARNDTSSAPGHQGGIVIPKDISQFFPILADPGNNPTVDQELNADLFINGTRVASVTTRFQHQTWGGTRSPERRLTSNLGKLRDVARADDIVLFRKDLDDDEYIQIHLIQQGSEVYREIEKLVGSRRWGSLDTQNPPVSISEIKDAEAFLDATSSEPPVAFSNDRETQTSISVRKARDRAFRRTVLQIYNYKCAFTGQSFASPKSTNIFGLDAAHVTPVSFNGSDHPANGLALTKDMHWAFDKGLIGVTETRKIYVPKRVADLDGNDRLSLLNGKPLRESSTPALRVMDEAFAWHRKNTMVG